MNVAGPLRSCVVVVVLCLLACGRKDGGVDAGSGIPSGDGGCGAVAAGSSTFAYATVAGVAPELLSLDVYTPAMADSCAQAPIVIWVHGGAWAIGDKGNKMADKIRLFNGAGWVLVSVNYRLSPETASTDPARVKYPIHPQDVAAAVHWVKTHAADLRGDPAHLALLGHSAGAHLVALLSTDQTFLGAQGDQLSDLRCTGSFDTEGYDIPGTLATASAMQRAILENAFGVDPAVQALASPKTHVAAGKGIPPFLIVARGGADREATERAFAQSLTAAGITAGIIDANNLTHEEVNDHIGAAGDTVMTARVMDFLNGCL